MLLTTLWGSCREVFETWGIKDTCISCCKAVYSYSFYFTYDRKKSPDLIGDQTHVLCCAKQRFWPLSHLLLWKGHWLGKLSKPESLIVPRNVCFTSRYVCHIVTQQNPTCSPNFLAVFTMETSAICLMHYHHILSGSCSWAWTKHTILHFYICSLFNQEHFQWQWCYMHSTQNKLLSHQFDRLHHHCCVKVTTIL